jgi:protein-disulfide isomerase/uncharacterized membrane protein YphA (DoxX/SURF4 family)
VSSTTMSAPAGPRTPASGRWTATREWLATVARLVLAAVWIYGGASKIGDPAASLRSVRAYRLLPEWLAKAVAYGLPYAEVALGLLLLVGLAVRLAALVSVALLVLYLAAIVSAAARGLRIECGCFGGGGDLAAGAQTRYTVEIVRDVGLLLLSGLLAWWPRTRLAADDAVRRAGAEAEAARVGPRRSRAAQERMAALAEMRRQEGERRVQRVSALCGVLLVVVAGVGIGVQAARTDSGGPRPQAIDVAEGVKIGSDNPRVIIDIFEDFQCPACKGFEDSAGPVLADYADSDLVQERYHMIAFLDRESPNRYSSRSANAGYCAADAGVFPEFHGLLFANQPAEGTPGPSNDQLVGFGRQAGATSQTFANCVLTEKYKGFVSDATTGASKGGIVGTPTVLVNGEMLQQFDGSSLREAVSRALGR